MTRARAKTPAGTPANTSDVIEIPSGTPAKTREKKERRARELAMELDGLRAALTEMVEAYRFRVDAELVQLGAVASGESTHSEKPRKLSAAAAQKMLDRIRSTELKPAKGRPKDFQRLQNLVDDLMKVLPAEK